MFLCGLFIIVAPVLAAVSVLLGMRKEKFPEKP